MHIPPPPPNLIVLQTCLKVAPYALCHRAHEEAAHPVHVCACARFVCVCVCVCVHVMCVCVYVCLFTAHTPLRQQLFNDTHSLTTTTLSKCHSSFVRA